MKLTIVLILVFCIQISASGNAQKVAISEKSASLQKIFKQIHKQTGYQFFYEDELLDKVGQVELSIKNATLSEALDKCFSNLPLAYEIVNKTIVVKHKPKPQDLPKANFSMLLPNPTITVKGIVRNENGDQLPGIAILVKGSSKGVSSSENGSFVLENIDPKSVLVFSGVSVETLELSVNNRISFVVTMKNKFFPLDEIQLIAYGQTTKRLKTGSMNTVKSETFEKQAVTNPAQAVQGRVAGLAITQTGGAIGSNIEIQIRGVNTIQSGSQPLIILDGAILPSLTSSGSGGYMAFGGTALNAINPADIESMDILKDADATAIYGSRGANGVIIITTKKAKLGATKFSIDMSNGFNKAINLAPRMDLSKYLQMRKDAFAMGNNNPTTNTAINPIAATTALAPDLLTWDQTQTTANWSDYEFGNPAPLNNVQASLSGGQKKLNFYASAGYFKQNDITRGNPFQERISGNLNINHISINDKFKISFNTNYVNEKLIPSRGAVQVLGGLVQSLPPNMPLKNPDGTAWWPTSTITQNGLLTNPDAVETATQSSITSSLINNIDLSYQLWKGLSFKTQFGYNYQSSTRETTLPSTAINPLIPGTLLPSSTSVEAYFQSINVEPQLNYTGNIGSGKFEALIGSTFFDRQTKTYQANFSGYSSDQLLNSWAAATNVTSRSSIYNYYRFNSVFGRLNYNWQNKYLVNLTFRRDGSTRFGSKNQWGNFGAIGAGWIFTNEKNWNKTIPALSYGKLRGSYGSTGNDNILDYRWTSLYTATNIWYAGASGLAATYLSDSSISWETTKKLDLAMELGFFKDRLLLTVNWFKTSSSNLLAESPVPGNTGFISFITNLPAVVENKGWEIELNTQNLSQSSQLKWKTSFNLTLLKNTLLQFPGLENSAYANKLKIGLPINSPRYPLATEWTQAFEGVDKSTGMPIYTDFNKDGVINTLDVGYVGSAIPRTFGGIGNTLSYKGIELDFFFQFSQQLTTNWIYGSTYPGQLSNPVDAWYGNYWKNPGDETKYPRLYTGTTGTNTNLMSTYFPTSSAALTDLMYVRLKNVSLSYTLPNSLLSKWNISRVQLYVHAQNLATWTSEKIYKDPELIQLRSGQMYKTWTAGIKATF